MNWQEKYYEIAMQAIQEGMELQNQIDHQSDPMPTDVILLTATNKAKKIADMLDRLHDMDVNYRKESADAKIIDKINKELKF